jgi:ATP phosphoribosyltransferase
MTLKLGLPSKGRLQADAIDWFAARGVTLERTGSEREYAGRVMGVQGVDLVLLSAAEIPGELARGRIHLGITGQDLVREKIPRWPDAVVELGCLGFGRADLVVAVPSLWIDVNDMADLDAVAADFRAAYGFRLRVATKYHHLVRDFFRARGVADYQLVDSQGATEGAVKNLTAEAVADITTTGSTLRDNHLKILADGLVLESQATLFAARQAGFDAQAHQALAVLCERLGLPAIQEDASKTTA